MKKQLLLLVFLFASIGASAQTDQGSLLLGGEMNFSHADNASTFEMSPRIGFFIIDNLAVGAGLTIVTNPAYTSFGITPFTRYYFMAADNLGIFGQASLNFNRTKTKDDTPIKTNGLDIGLDVGLAVFLNDNVAIEPHFGIGVGAGDQKGVIFGIGVGVQAYLSK